MHDMENKLKQLSHNARKKIQIGLRLLYNTKMCIDSIIQFQEIQLKLIYVLKLFVLKCALQCYI